MKEILESGFDEMGINYTDTQISQLEKYARLLVKWNEVMNLTAITDMEEIATKHFLDSASAINTGVIKGKVIDVGTGAGFPGLVLKIMKPEIELTLLDSLNKRLNFLKAVTDELLIDDVTFIHSRAEEGVRIKGMRESYDVAVSRAVANMTLLSELCMGYVKKGGNFVALKGPNAEDEAKSAKRAITIMGGEIDKIMDATVPHTPLDHKIIIVKKVRQTPIKFPRKPALISKAPIETCYNIKKKPVK